MVDIRVSELATAGALTGDELIMISQNTGLGLASCKLTLSELANFGYSSPGDWFAPGEYIFAGIRGNYNTQALGPGQSRSGSELLIGGVRQKEGTKSPELLLKPEYTVPGTWSTRGYLEGGWLEGQLAVEGSAATLFRRVDGLMLSSWSSRIAVQQVQDTTLLSTVRNSRWVNDDHTAIDCEIRSGDTWFPFTATPGDCALWGREIFAQCATLLTDPEGKADE